MPVIAEIKNLSKHFVEDGKNRQVLRDINLQISEREFLMLLGPSGSGKSTLLRLLAGLDRPSSGALEFKKKLNLSLIFQNFALFPWLTTAENIEFGLKMKDIKPAERKKIVKLEIEKMGLTGFAQSYPRELSGGMKQRVGIARALAVSPDLLLLDEPFSALDSFTAKKLRQELLEIWQSRKLTVVMVTHLVEEALLLADRVAVLTQRPATVEQVFVNPLPRPRDQRSPEFFAQSDKIEAAIK